MKTKSFSEQRVWREQHNRRKCTFKPQGPKCSTTRLVLRITKDKRVLLYGDRLSRFSGTLTGTGAGSHELSGSVILIGATHYIIPAGYRLLASSAPRHNWRGI
jgi:hypothetical protein